MGGQILFLVAVAACSGLEVYPHASYNRRVRVTNEEKLSKYVMLLVSAFFGFGARLADPWFALGFRAPFTAVRRPGALLILVSVVLRVASVRAMGRWYSVNLGVLPGQPLVTRGPYRLLRHPGWHWLATPLSWVLPLTVMAWRIRIEERMLESAFGEVYRVWARRTWRLVPGLW